MYDKVLKKYKQLQEDLDSYVSQLVNGNLFTEEYLTKKIMELKIQIWLLEELMENED